MISDFISSIINNTITNFDFSFCVVVNIATYGAIKTITDSKKGRKLSTWIKRIVFLVMAAVCVAVYAFCGADIKVLFNSVILAPVSWSWLFKPICKKLNIDYDDKRDEIVKIK